MCMCMPVPMYATHTRTDGDGLQYEMPCYGITLAGSPGSDMLYFVTFAVLKSPEHLWVHVAGMAMPPYRQWANNHGSMRIHMDTKHDGVFMTYQRVTMYGRTNTAPMLVVATHSDVHTVR